MKKCIIEVNFTMQMGKVEYNTKLGNVEFTYFFAVFLFTVYGLFGFYAQSKSDLDRILLKDGTEEYGTITKKSFAGIELKKDKEIVKIEYDKIQNHFFSESKNEFELVYDSLLTGNFAKASAQLLELEAKTKRQVIKEDIKFYLAISYYYQKNYDKFFNTLGALVKEFPETYYMNNILSFIVDISDMLDVRELSTGLTDMVSQIVSGITKQKNQQSTFLENVGKTLNGFIKESSGNYTEAQNRYQEVINKYSSDDILYIVGENFIIRNLLRNNNLNDAVRRLEKLKGDLIKQENVLFIKNAFSLLGDVYRKQAEDLAEGKEKFLKKALYAYMHVYILNVPTITELPEIYAKSMYYIYYIMSELAKTEKDENKKNEYLTKAQAIKNELKQKYGNSVWAGKLE